MWNSYLYDWNRKRVMRHIPGAMDLDSIKLIQGTKGRLIINMTKTGTYGWIMD